MLPDALAVTLRALSFVAMFQAAGAALFVVVFGRQLPGALGGIRRLVRVTGLAAILLVIAHYGLEAARLAGELAGVLDADLQRLVLGSPSGAVLVLRGLGLALILAGARRGDDFAAALAAIGTTLVVVSFVLTGHVSAHPERWALTGLIVIHLLAVTFWFGALAPLHLASSRESVAAAAAVVEAFSARAVWIVPGLFLAGLAAALVLVRELSVLTRPYGMLLLAKVAGFALLMGLASLNRWRLAPAVSRGDTRAARQLRHSLAAEWALIATVLAITATMTSLFSPEH